MHLHTKRVVVRFSLEVKKNWNCFLKTQIFSKVKDNINKYFFSDLYNNNLQFASLPLFPLQTSLILHIPSRYTIILKTIWKWRVKKKAYFWYQFHWQLLAFRNFIRKRKKIFPKLRKIRRIFYQTFPQQSPSLNVTFEILLSTKNKTKNTW